MTSDRWGGGGRACPCAQTDRSGGTDTSADRAPWQHWLGVVAARDDRTVPVRGGAGAFSSVRTRSVSAPDQLASTSRTSASGIPARRTVPSRSTAHRPTPPQPTSRIPTPPPPPSRQPAAAAPLRSGTREPAPPSAAGTGRVWQYTENGAVPGLRGQADVNVHRGTLTQLRTLAHLSPGQTPTHPGTGSTTPPAPSTAVWPLLKNGTEERDARRQRHRRPAPGGRGRPRSRSSVLALARRDLQCRRTALPAREMRSGSQPYRPRPPSSVIYITLGRSQAATETGCLVRLRGLGRADACRASRRRAAVPDAVRLPERSPSSRRCGRMRHSSLSGRVRVG